MTNLRSDATRPNGLRPGGARRDAVPAQPEALQTLVGGEAGDEVAARQLVAGELDAVEGEIQIAEGAVARERRAERRGAAARHRVV